MLGSVSEVVMGLVLIVIVEAAVIKVAVCLIINVMTLGLILVDGTSVGFMGNIMNVTVLTVVVVLGGVYARSVDGVELTGTVALGTDRVSDRPIVDLSLNRVYSHFPHAFKAVGNDAPVVSGGILSQSTFGLFEIDVASVLINMIQDRRTFLRGSRSVCVLLHHLDDVSDH
jgi:hypothetical protein